MKKHIRNGGTSETHLGSQDFNPRLIEPMRKIKPELKLSPINHD